MRDGVMSDVANDQSRHRAFDSISLYCGRLSSLIALVLAGGYQLYVLPPVGLLAARQQASSVQHLKAGHRDWQFGIAIDVRRKRS